MTVRKAAAFKKTLRVSTKRSFSGEINIKYIMEGKMKFAPSHCFIPPYCDIQCSVFLISSLKTAAVEGDYQLEPLHPPGTLFLAIQLNLSFTENLEVPTSSF